MVPSSRCLAAPCFAGISLAHWIRRVAMGLSAARPEGASKSAQTRASGV